MTRAAAQGALPPAETRETILAALPEEQSAHDTPPEPRNLYIPPRHAKAYRNFAEEYRRLQRERIAAFSEYIADVQQGRFPERRHLVEMDDVTLQSVIAELGGPAA